MFVYNAEIGDRVLGSNEPIVIDLTADGTERCGNCGDPINDDSLCYCDYLG